MNYELSTKILEAIRESERILINCHRNPDPDSIGSALAMKMILEGMGKVVKVICPTKIDKGASFLKGFGEIEIVNFSKFDFSKFGLFVTLDSSTWDMVTGAKDVPKPENLKIITIDHHHTNDEFGEINLIDPKKTSTAEFLYEITKDWGVEIQSDTATALLAGIISDTGAFRFPGATKETLLIAAELISKGANKEKIIYHLYSNLELRLLKLVGEMIGKTEIDEASKFCWCAIPFSLYEKYGKIDGAKEYAANTFIQSVKDTDFGIIMMETETKKLSVSFRSRGGFDVSRVALALGGGGHKAAAGVTLSGLKFKGAVNKVLEAARKVADENQS